MRAINDAENATPEEVRFIEEHKDLLSKTTQRAKWIHSAEEHGAEPATVPGTEHGDRHGVLRFDFLGYQGREIEKITWEEWFRPFDERELVFVFQEHKTDGSQSNFFRLDNPERESA